MENFSRFSMAAFAAIILTSGHALASGHSGHDCAMERDTAVESAPAPAPMVGHDHSLKNEEPADLTTAIKTVMKKGATCMASGKGGVCPMSSLLLRGPCCAEECRTERRKDQGSSSFGGLGSPALASGRVSYESLMVSSKAHDIIDSINLCRKDSPEPRPPSH